MSTLILHHENCLRHDTGFRHVERPERITAVMDSVRQIKGTEVLPAPRATLEQLTLVHPADYWDQLVELEPGGNDKPGLVALDGDTFMSRGSIDATLRGSGAACFAIEQIEAGKAKNAFCPVRPPGHHALSMVPMGFCLLNHVAVAARYAIESGYAEKVAILDFDVHHGNGTQAIFEESPEVLFVSSHQMPLFPGSGSPQETGVGNIVNLPLSPGDGGETFHAAWSGRGLPAVERFKPDLVLVSAGFDAHERDPLGGLLLKDEDYGWITAEIRKLAESHCGGKVVSMLEGGYDLEALETASAAHVQALTS
jgi:acetoin utilization deacetylase AcuC-like enzyme